MINPVCETRLLSALSSNLTTLNLEHRRRASVDPSKEERGEGEKSWGAGPYTLQYIQIIAIRLRKQGSLQMKSAKVVCL